MTLLHSACHATCNTSNIKSGPDLTWQWQWASSCLPLCVVLADTAAYCTVGGGGGGTGGGGSSWQQGLGSQHWEGNPLYSPFHSITTCVVQEQKKRFILYMVQTIMTSNISYHISCTTSLQNTKFRWVTVTYCSAKFSSGLDVISAQHEMDAWQLVNRLICLKKPVK